MSTAFNIRQATPGDVGEIAYMIMSWARDELPEAVRIMSSEPWQAERTANIIVFMPDYHTRVMENGQGVVGAYVVQKYPTAAFGDEPYASLLGIYVKPEHRGHKFFGLKLLQDAHQEIQSLGYPRMYINPMVKSRSFSSILKRMGYAPLCVTHVKRF